MTIDDRGIGVRRLSGSLGAEITGLPLGEAGAAEVELLRGLLREHLVLFLPGQHLDPDRHVAFGRLFGQLESHPNLDLRAERPEFFQLHARGGIGGIADEWHSDLSCADEPSVLSILQMAVCPEVGGDTLWANMYRAYETLSPAMREICEGLTALHDADPHGHSERTAIHPVVRVHPETGRKSLFVNEHFTRRIVELSHQESDALLGFLVRWASSPRFTVRYRWTKGTVAIWDNRCTQHHVLDDFEGDRLIQRVTVMGDQPKGVGAPRWEPYVSPLAASSRHDRQLSTHLRERSGKS